MYGKDPLICVSCKSVLIQRIRNWNLKHRTSTKKVNNAIIHIDPHAARMEKQRQSRMRNPHPNVHIDAATNTGIIFFGNAPANMNKYRSKRRITPSQLRQLILSKKSPKSQIRMILNTSTFTQQSQPHSFLKLLEWDPIPYEITKLPTHIDVFWGYRPVQAQNQREKKQQNMIIDQVVVLYRGDKDVTDIRRAVQQAQLSKFTNCCIIAEIGSYQNQGEIHIDHSHHFKCPRQQKQQLQQILVEARAANIRVIRTYHIHQTIDYLSLIHRQLSISFMEELVTQNNSSSSKANESGSGVEVMSNTGAGNGSSITNVIDNNSINSIANANAKSENINSKKDSTSMNTTINRHGNKHTIRNYKYKMIRQYHQVQLMLSQLPCNRVSQVQLNMLRQFEYYDQKCAQMLLNKYHGLRMLVVQLNEFKTKKRMVSYLKQSVPDEQLRLFVFGLYCLFTKVNQNTSKGCAGQNWNSQSTHSDQRISGIFNQFGISNNNNKKDDEIEQYDVSNSDYDLQPEVNGQTMENKTAKMDMTNPNSNDEFEQRRKQVDLSMKIHSYRRSDTDTITIEQLLLNMQVSQVKAPEARLI